MKPANRILVAIDGSDNSTRALEYARKRVSALGNPSLLILNVQPAMPSSRFGSPSMIAEHHDRCSKAALKTARAVLRRRKLDAEIHVRVGDPATTIVNVAKQKRCAEIVMGSRGRGRVAGLLLGSVAAKVIQLAPCPVTIVK